MYTLFIILAISPFVLGATIVPMIIRRQYRKKLDEREYLANFTGENTSHQERIQEIKDEMIKLYPNINISHLLK